MEYLAYILNQVISQQFIETLDVQPKRSAWRLR